jgi:predicted CXXCH cytochrome family protein
VAGAIAIASVLVAVSAFAEAATGAAAQAPLAGPAISGSAARYPLVASTASTAVAIATDAAIHGPYSMTSDQCEACHRSHTAPSRNLLDLAAPQSTLCFTCHDGTGAADIKSQFTKPGIPANNPGTRSYYGHDVLTASAHTSANTDEFGGVSNRHSECGDCHNPHQAGDGDSTSTGKGWTASGALAGVSGVSVVNGPAGTAPTYTFLDGLTAPVTAEYQLCFKCHSGFTTLPSNAGFTPSRYLLDKGIEFNPNNPSYHPVESPGRNQTAAMAASLAGASPYKRWNFTPGSTIRCVNCHADNTVDSTAAGGNASSHRSVNRSMLLLNYRDRVLKPAGEPYAAADFALCYLCHADSPFVGEGSTATNFRLHAKHVSGIGDAGSGGTNIDTAGAGQGNALCAECHFRIHSVSYKVGDQTISGSRLVNFAPDVIADNGVLSWTAGTSGGTCTLTCHGETHTNARYGGSG